MVFFSWLYLFLDKMGDGLGINISSAQVVLCGLAFGSKIVL
jgi:hypothetical protein